ncbi:hypothetical protein SAMN05192561_11262 [Halopenitus malekzadehii]|uniref:Uncharacterized protein n=1 Tax=Halopenitus malekzadehii TaxID=1267564 RepID=A0A1H6JPK9_9EURY|nr:hypothetical protein [Halopenitus malekzadehii]SEH61002.1 hypothetical protein SAMN05192561_11262 [Halopenitus malekzadehii]
MFTRLFETVDWIDPSEPITLVAPVVAFVATVLLTHPALDHLGRDTELLRRVRGALPLLDEAARDHGFYTSYDITDEEVIGVVYRDLEDVEATLQELNFRPSPLAAHKSLPDGRTEIGSWGRFGGVDVDRLPWPLSTLFLLVYPFQDPHVTLFPAERGDVGDESFPDGAVLVTGHHEKSPYNPFVAYQHLRGKGYDVDRGVKLAANLLVDELGDDFTPSDRAIALAGNAVAQ